VVATFLLPFKVTKKLIKYTTSIPWYNSMAYSIKITTVKIDRETKARLDKLKVHPKESYDEIIQKILFILNLCKANPEEARGRLIAIDKVKKLNEMNSAHNTKKQR